MYSSGTGLARRQEDHDRNGQFRQLVQLAPDAILVHDGVRIVLANAAAVRLARGSERTDLEGQPIDHFLDPPYLKSVQMQLLDTIASGTLSPPVRDTFRRLDGSTVEVEVRAVAFLDHGNPSAHLVIRDISERLAVDLASRQVEERLQQAQRMESVGALAGGVAHEVNNMMQVIVGFGDFLVADARLPSDAVDDVKEILQAARRAATVTKQLLAFSRRAVHAPVVVDLGAAVHDAESMLRRLLGEERPLEIVAEGEPRVWADPGQLHQVLVNLVLNARDAMPTGGRLTITTRETTLERSLVASGGSVVPAGAYGTLAVRDTGSGIAADVLARIFEPFFTTKPIGEGTGLGLAAAHGVLAQNGGYITVVSLPGEGATFTVYLPLLPASVRVEPQAEPPRFNCTAPHARATVLVVDDEPALRTIAGRILERGGFEVRLAAGAEEALALVDQHGPPAVLLTDLLMPHISGPELAHRLRKRWPALPIIFMSGYLGDAQHAPEANGAIGEILLKPFVPAELLAKVVAAAETCVA